MAGEPGADRAWAIPVATDIAFALAVLAVVVSVLPRSVRVFLLSLADVDDLVATSSAGTETDAAADPSCCSRDLRWADLAAVAVLGGVGFTVSLLITELAFTDPAATERVKTARCCSPRPSRDRGRRAAAPAVGHTRSCPLNCSEPTGVETNR